MDPVAALGLVVNVIQIVTFSIQTVKVCQEVYQKGSTSKYNDLGDSAGDLANLTNSLQQSLQSPGARSGPLTKDDTELVELGRKCQDYANKLQKELGKLETQQRLSRLAAARVAVRTIFKRNNIDRIHKELQAY